MTSVVTLMAASLHRELDARGLHLPAAECAHIMRIVIASTADAARTYEASLPTLCLPGGPLTADASTPSDAPAVDFSPSATPAPRTSDGGRAPSGDAPAVYFSEATIKEILTQHFCTGEPGERDAIKAAAQILAALTPVRGAP